MWVKTIYLGISRMIATAEFHEVREHEPSSRGATGVNPFFPKFSWMRFFLFTDQIKDVQREIRYMHTCVYIYMGGGLAHEWIIIP